MKKKKFTRVEKRTDAAGNTTWAVGQWEMGCDSECPDCLPVETVYVDKAKNPYGRMKMSHLGSASLSVLHAFAKELGLKPEWFQDSALPHYDICQSYKKRALELGAVEIECKDFIKIMREAHPRKKKRQNMRLLRILANFYFGNINDISDEDLPGFCDMNGLYIFVNDIDDGMPATKFVEEIEEL